MFSAISRAFHDAQNKDEGRRKSKRLSNSKPEEDEPALATLQTGQNEEVGNSREKVHSFSLRRQSSFSDDDDLEEDDDDLTDEHPRWENDYIFTLYMIGFAVGGSNLWRFGFLCFEYGGIIFLIPYFFFTAVCALPCLYLELLIGQYAQVGTIAAWKIAPLFKGVGMCMILLSFMACFNLQTVLAWCLFYIFQATFHNPLPWISCDNGFGKKRNGQKDPTKEKWIPEEGNEDEHINWHTENCTEFFADSGTDGSLAPNERLPGTEFFRGRVQRMWKSAYADRTGHSNFSYDNGVIVFGIDRPDQGMLEYNTDTFMCLIVVFFFLMLCISRGINLSPKLMVNFVLFPYVLLLLLFYRATGLTGAWSGLADLFEPDGSQLFKTETWWRAAEQVYYSTGAGFGIHLTLASHNHFSRRIVYDAAITVAVNIATSLLAACTIFMYLGHVKVTVNRELQIFVRSGPELVFEVMSDVLGVLAKSNFYAFCFYLCLFLLVFTTVIASLIGAKFAYVEILPVSVKYRTGSRIILVTLIYVVSFIVSSLNLTRGGLHTFEFVNSFNGLYSIVLCSFLFLIGTAWCFGLKEITDAASAMGIRLPGLYFQICWKFVSPVALIIVLGGLISHTRDTIHFDGEDIQLNLGLSIVGFIMAIGPLLVVLGGAAHALWQAPGQTFKEKFLLCISPTREHEEIIATGKGKRGTLAHYFYIYAPTPGAKCNVFCSFQRKNKVTPQIDVEEADFQEILPYNPDNTDFKAPNSSNNLKAPVEGQNSETNQAQPNNPPAAPAPPPKT